jgi:hypothetical protein
MRKSYTTLEGPVLQGWTALVSDLDQVDGWEHVDLMQLRDIANTQCICILDVYSQIHSVPFPLNWEWA